MSVIYRYCPLCANPLQPFNDKERLRSICEGCGWIHYLNPTVGVAVVLITNRHILLGERQNGGWCIPCGHVEWDETVEEAAVREFAEETGLTVSLDSILSVQSNFHDPKHHTVGIWYLGKRVSGFLHPGGDLLQVSFFPLDNIPSLRFPTDQHVINLMTKDKL
jgi:ADP-ribose pyrophosphatase YjhB (NUDIX family)